MSTKLLQTEANRQLQACYEGVIGVVGLQQFCRIFCDTHVHPYHIFLLSHQGIGPYPSFSATEHLKTSFDFYYVLHQPTGVENSVIFLPLFSNSRNPFVFSTFASTFGSFQYRLSQIFLQPLLLLFFREGPIAPVLLFESMRYTCKCKLFRQSTFSQKGLLASALARFV